MQSTPAQVHLAQQEIEAAQAAVRSELARFERAAAALSKHVTQLQQGFKQVGP
jgi:IS1 family transposase